MGLVWSDGKYKQDTLLVAKAIITEEIRDDFWLLWGIAKNNPAMKESIKKDGFGISKERFDGHRWTLVWFHKIKDDSYEEVETDDGLLYKWQKELNDLTHKWIVKLAAIKDAIAGSDDEGGSVEDPYDYKKNRKHEDVDDADIYE
jgi:hypothetical protein